MCSAIKPFLLHLNTPRDLHFRVMSRSVMVVCIECTGNSEAAQGVLQKCLDQHEGFCDGHLLMAEISLHTKAPKMAESSLEKALSHSFEVHLCICLYHTLSVPVGHMIAMYVHLKYH